MPRHKPVSRAALGAFVRSVVETHRTCACWRACKTDRLTGLTPASLSLLPACPSWPPKSKGQGVTTATRAHSLVHPLSELTADEYNAGT